MSVPPLTAFTEDRGNILIVPAGQFKGSTIPNQTNAYTKDLPTSTGMVAYEYGSDSITVQTNTDCLSRLGISVSLSVVMDASGGVVETADIATLASLLAGRIETALDAL